MQQTQPVVLQHPCFYLATRIEKIEKEHKAEKRKKVEILNEKYMQYVLSDEQLEKEMSQIIHQSYEEMYLARNRAIVLEHIKVDKDCLSELLQLTLERYERGESDSDKLEKDVVRAYKTYGELMAELIKTIPASRNITTQQVTEILIGNA